MKKIFLVILLSITTLFSATLEQAKHRLPPVIYSLDIPKVVKSGKTYSFKWTVMGYHKTYDMGLVIYNSNNKAIIRKRLSPVNVTKGSYHYENIYSKRFWFKTDVKIPKLNKNQDLIVRFFISPPYDDIDTNFLSCLVPGGLGYDVADTSGRKIKIRGLKAESDNSNNNNQNVNYYLDLPYRGSYKVSQGNNAPKIKNFSHYNHGAWENTYAIDIALPKNTPVLAPADATVACIYDENHNGGKACGYKPNYGCIGGGRVIVLKDNKGNLITLLHLSAIDVQVGNKVPKGYVVAYSGASKGVSSSGGRCIENGFAPHLHMHLWNEKGTPDSHTKPFDSSTPLRVKVNGQVKFLYGSELNDNKIRGQLWESLQ